MAKWTEETKGLTTTFRSSENAELALTTSRLSDTGCTLETRNWAWGSKSLLQLSAFLLLKAQELAANEKK